MTPDHRNHPDATEWQGVAYGVILGALAAFQQYKLPPVLPLLNQTYGYGQIFTGSLMSVFAISGLILSWPAGRACSKQGPRGVLIGSFGCFVAGSALGLAAPQQGWAMLASRLLEGTGFTLVAVTGAVICTSSASKKHKTTATALWATWIPLGQIIAAASAIPLIREGQWRPLWVGALLLTLALALWGHRLAASGSKAFKAPPKHSHTQNKQDNSATRPTRSSTTLIMSATLFALWSMQFTTLMTWLPTYLVEVRGLNTAAAAGAYLGPPFFIIAFNLIAGALLNSGWSLGALLGGSISAQAAIWLLAPLTDGVFAGTLSLATYGVTSGVIPTCLFSLPNTLMSDEVSAPKSFAALMTGRNVGVLIGPVMFGWLINLENGWPIATTTFGTASLASLALCWALLKRGPDRQKHRPQLRSAHDADV